MLATPVKCCDDVKAEVMNHLKTSVEDFTICYVALIHACILV